MIPPWCDPPVTVHLTINKYSRCKKKKKPFATGDRIGLKRPKLKGVRDNLMMLM